ncbi:LAMI_0G08130g1_1 [Lachancea mirantina]|uniref:Autophagy-related protein 27 n=1 Tax=Lachancea mirantina TaxID=1230905 RepID=A0A1G4K9Z9_9SACH|nr:LAMI_0G08130g1_1 [Lachancea mirantina]
MRFANTLLVGLAICRLSAGKKCSQNDILRKYNIDENGVLYEKETSTPPSITKESWWINVCSDNEQDAPENCKSDDVVCGQTFVSFPDDKEQTLTQLVEFSSEAGARMRENDQNQLTIEFGDVKWGQQAISAKLTYTCDSDADSDSVVGAVWKDKQVNFDIKGPSGCLKKREDNGDDSDDGDGDNGRDDRKPKKSSGFGTWLFSLIVYALLFTLIYLLATSYLSTRGGTFHDFREEFAERAIGFASSVPQFLKEVISRIMGRGAPHQRGGYSAV